MTPKAAKTLKVIDAAESGITRAAVAKTMGYSDESAAKFINSLVKAGHVLMLGRCGDRTIRYCTPRNRAGTMERIELMRYGSSTGRHMTDEEFDEWVEFVSHKVTSAKDAPPVVTKAPRSIFHMAEMA